MNLALVVLLVPTPATEITHAIVLDSQAVSLSDSVMATLTIEGPAPLWVRPAADVLAAESAAAWRVQTIGEPKVETLPDGRQRWEQRYRLDPYQTGDPLPIQFAPFQAQAGDAQRRELEWPVQKVRVETTVKVIPSPAEARSVTGIEELPPPPRVGWNDAYHIYLILGTIIQLLAIYTGWAIWQAMRAKPEPTPRERAVAELERLNQSNIDPPAFAELLSQTLRDYLARRFQTATDWRTTAELLAHARQQPAPWWDIQGETVRAVREACDLVKFAGVGLGDAERAGLIAQAHSIVEWEPPAGAK
jgi:hypothetical protein